MKGLIHFYNTFLTTLFVHYSPEFSLLIFSYDSDFIIFSIEEIAKIIMSFLKYG